MRILRRAVGIVFLAAAVAFGAKFFLENRVSMLEAWGAFTWTKTVISALFAIAGINLFPVSLWALYRGLGDTKIAFRPFWLAYALANVFKYIPGKVVTFVALVEGVDRTKVSQAQMTQAVVAMLGMSVCISALMLGVGVLPWIGSRWWLAPALLLLAAVMVLAFHPSSNATVLGLALRIAKRAPPESRFTPASLLQAASVLTVGWLLLGASLAFLVHEEGDSFRSVVFTVLSYPGAFAAGIVALFAPAGAGVREGVVVAALVQILPARMTASSAASLAIGHRLLLTVIDLVLLLCWALARIRDKARARNA